MLTNTVSRDDSFYAAFPDLVKADDGTLICVFMETEHHLKRPFARLMMTKSFDNGKTWTKKEVFASFNNDTHKYNCPRLSMLPDKSISLVCDFQSNFNESELGNTELNLHLWRSFDNGKTWSSPELLSNFGIVPDKYRILSNGRHCISAHKKDKSGHLTVYFYYSDNCGESWNKVTMAEDKRFELCEPCVVEIEKGILVAFIRENSMIGLSCKKAISYDYGTTWEGVFDTNIDACHRPTVDFITENTLLMTYRMTSGGCWGSKWGVNQNTMGAFFTKDTALAKERDHHHAKIFPIAFDRSPEADSGYTGWVKLEDNSIYVVTYMVDDAKKAQIKGFNFASNEFYLGKFE